MPEPSIPDYLQLTVEESKQIEILRVFRGTVQLMHSQNEAAGVSWRPDYMQDAQIFSNLESWAGGSLAEVKLALIDGVDVNAKDEKGMTTLHYAVQHANIRVVNLLLKAGADTEIKSAQGQTPIELAASLKENALVRLMKREVSID